MQCLRRVIDSKTLKRVQINLDYTCSVERAEYIRRVRDLYCMSLTSLVYRAVKYYAENVLCLKERDDCDE